MMPQCDRDEEFRADIINLDEITKEHERRIKIQVIFHAFEGDACDIYRKFWTWDTALPLV